MLKNKILTPSLETIGEEIGQELGAKMVKDFQDANPNDTHAYYIGRNIIDQILAQPGCVGIRFYMGLNEVGEKNLVYVGVDANDQLITEYKVIDETGKISDRPGIVADRSNPKTSTSTGTWDWSV